MPAQKTAIRKMVAKWLSRQDAAEQVTIWSKRKQELDKQIIEFMQANGLKAIESEEEGVRITLVQPEPVVYDAELLKDKLKRSAKGRAVLARCTVEVIDMAAIAAEVQAGNIDSKLVAQASSIKPVAPSLRSGKIE